MSSVSSGKIAMAKDSAELGETIAMAEEKNLSNLADYKSAHKSEGIEAKSKQEDEVKLELDIFGKTMEAVKTTMNSERFQKMTPWAISGLLAAFTIWRVVKHEREVWREIITGWIERGCPLPNLDPDNPEAVGGAVRQLVRIRFHRVD